MPEPLQLAAHDIEYLAETRLTGAVTDTVEVVDYYRSEMPGEHGTILVRAEAGQWVGMVLVESLPKREFEEKYGKHPA